MGTIRGVVPLREDGRIPSLDGLRAVSIGAVVLGHLAGTVNFPAFIGDAVRNTGLVDVANLGVRVFFVISGFLITGILLKENQRYGTLSLRRFYLRRTMRIFPAYYVFVATIVGLTAIGVEERVDFEGRGLRGALIEVLAFVEDHDVTCAG